MRDIDEYQEESCAKRLYKVHIGHEIIYPTLGLGSEIGEFQGKIKKLFRDGEGRLTAADREALKLELGDIMWYVAVCAQSLDLKMSEILEANLAKLKSRRRRARIKGDGDDR